MQGPAGAYSRTTSGAITDSTSFLPKILLFFQVIASTAYDVRIRNKDGSGQLICGAAGAAAGISAPVALPPEGVACPDGIFVDVVSGTITAAIVHCA